MDIQELYAEAHRAVEAGRRGEAMQCFARLLPLLEQAADEVGKARVLFEMGTLHEVEARPAEAARCYEQALAASRAAGDRRLEASVLHRLAHLARLRGEAERACGLFGESAQLAEGYGDAGAAAVSRAMIGQIHFTAGDEERGLAEMLGALASMPEESPDHGHICEHVMYFGRRMTRERYQALVAQHVSSAALRRQLLGAAAQ